MYVPDSIKDYYREPKQLSGLLLVGVLAVASVWVFELRVWSLLP